MRHIISRFSRFSLRPTSTTIATTASADKPEAKKLTEVWWHVCDCMHAPPVHFS